VDSVDASLIRRPDPLGRRGRDRGLAGSAAQCPRPYPAIARWRC